MKSDENIGEPVRECPGYEYAVEYAVEYEVEGEKCGVVMHAFADGSRQFMFQRGDTRQGIALSAAGVRAIKYMEVLHRNWVRE